MALMETVFGLSTPSYEWGVDSSIHWASEAYHILQTATQVPRSVEVVVRLAKAFPKRPEVAVANYLLDWEAGSG